jgi:hypothetical protein
MVYLLIRVPQLILSSYHVDVDQLVHCQSLNDICDCDDVSTLISPSKINIIIMGPAVVIKIYVYQYNNNGSCCCDQALCLPIQ